MLSRALSTPTYTPGGSVDVALRMERVGNDAVTALGVEETLPEGFAFDGIVGDVKPDIAPKQGQTGKIEFAWITVPQFPATVSYRVKAADGTTVIRKTYPSGRDGSEVVLVEVEGGGHTWPGQEPRLKELGKSTRNISANDLMWEFFQKHPMK